METFPKPTPQPLDLGLSMEAPVQGVLPGLEAPVEPLTRTVHLVGPDGRKFSVEVPIAPTLEIVPEPADAAREGADHNTAAENEGQLKLFEGPNTPNAEKPLPEPVRLEQVRAKRGLKLGKIAATAAAGIAAIKVGLPGEAIHDKAAVIGHSINAANVGLWGTRRALRVSHDGKDSRAREAQRITLDSSGHAHSKPELMSYNRYLNEVFLPKHQGDLRAIAAREFPNTRFEDIPVDVRLELVETHLAPVAFAEHDAVTREVMATDRVNDAVRRTRSDRIEELNSGPAPKAVERWGALIQNLRADKAAKEAGEMIEYQNLWGDAVKSEAGYRAARARETRRAGRKALDHAYKRYNHAQHVSGNILGLLGDDSNLHVEPYKAVRAAGATGRFVGKTAKILAKPITVPAQAIRESSVARKESKATRLEREAGYHIDGKDAKNLPTTRKTEAELQELAAKKQAKAATLRRKVNNRTDRAAAKALRRHQREVARAGHGTSHH